MPIHKGNNKIGSISKGSSDIAEAYHGNVKVFSKAVPVRYPVFRFKLSSSPYDPDAGSSYVPTTGTDSVRGTWTQVSANVWDCAVPDQAFFAEFQNKLTSGAYFYLIDVINADTLLSCSQLFAGCTRLISTC